MAKKSLVLIVASLISLVLVANHAVATEEDNQRERHTRLRQARQCRLHQISANQPDQRIESEGGVTEFWDEYDDQFQCTGVAAMRNIIRPNSLSLPNYSPAPRLVYIQEGRGLLGVTFSGCAQTYQSSRGEESYRGGSEGEREEQEGRRSRRDEHQRVQRVRRGDIVALPAGVAHWCHNDGNEDLVAISVSDLNNHANQLDQKLRSYFLAGGNREGSQGSERGDQHHRRGWESETFQNIFRNFDENLIAEALNVPEETVRNMQRDDDRGFIVRVREDMSVIRPDEYDEEERHRFRRERRERDETAENGLEETFCSMRIHHYLDEPREADVYSRHAGRLNSVNMFKLPILRYIDMSAEKGDLLPNAILAPHWNLNAHTIVYITRGEAHVQIVGNNGQTLMDDRVRDGDLFAIPQYFASALRAGRDGVEWVSFKTSRMPMKSPLVGSTSVFRAMPVQVLAEAFGIRIHEAQNLKFGREHHTLLLPSSRRSSYRE
ncbi:hypothetical protein NE237_014479 [Protea cynaroides]|uniref:Cupin type-1 domain-containing protein n=1 Tax=Protea cynaroides TaxID=273540 RepID=A0A9Q0KC39_9MAGN|nr:hypothetical protein NE237_014479 [Protea cynaroides]